MLPSSATVEGGGSVSSGLPELEAWFVTGSQRLYGDDVLRQVDEHAGRIAACLDETPAMPVRAVARPVVTSPDGIDGDTRAAAFKRELRRNHAYDFLDRGV
jgi:L-arabinose isomerase